VAVTDGERTAVYVPTAVKRVGEPDGSLSIVPDYTEAGRFCEANVLSIRDGSRVLIYEPVRVVS
jgi:hypothetical protein